jgi:hypothetical protein
MSKAIKLMRPGVQPVIQQTIGIIQKRHIIQNVNREQIMPANTTITQMTKGIGPIAITKEAIPTGRERITITARLKTNTAIIITGTDIGKTIAGIITVGGIIIPIITRIPIAITNTIITITTTGM